MNYKEQLIKEAKKRAGLITRKEIINLKIPSIYITRMIRSNELEKVDIGIYALTSENWYYDPDYNFSIRHKTPIFSYTYALTFFDFTDVIPMFRDVTVYHGYNAHNLDPQTRVHYVSKDIYELGVVEVKTNCGNKVRAYDIERTICDFIKHRDKIEAELFAKTMYKYSEYEKEIEKNFMNMLKKWTLVRKFMKFFKY
ncbi:type IV toxin-antitoxin system AbiEi family antitoxin domain-containing protein [Mycoplasma mycoides]|uniref:type IV toxin-antitoxin system AbiEi family antitoxin domain-containing protein n=1 Tax=Mycoplasma mycoides TaxID=2102 RepID=UPI00223FD3AB|nr:type IV toxin-antitoxin system AbiEi family antitoxin domain-containing protein [Mycoplasma mycoides]